MEDFNNSSPSSSRVTKDTESVPSINNNNEDKKTDEIDIEELLARPRHRRGLFRRQKASLNKAPEFVKRLNAFEEAKAGTAVVFSCQWQAFPRPTIKWYRDDEEISDENNRLQFKESDNGEVKLLINNCRKADEAAYKCKAENTEGVASTTGYLSVTGDIKEKPLSAQPRKNAQHAVSNPPRLMAIVEQKSLELREEEECSALPPSPIHDYVETFQKQHKATVRQKSPPFALDDLHKGEDDDSGSDTSVESQDFDRVRLSEFDKEMTPEADDIEMSSAVKEEDSRYSGAAVGLAVENSRMEDHNGITECPAVSVKTSAPIPKKNVAKKHNGIAKTAVANVNYVSSFSFAKVESPVLYGPVSESSNAQDSPAEATSVNHTTLEFPWLFALASTSTGTLVATATEMSPFLFVLLLAIISLLSFRFLLSKKKQHT